MNNKLYVGNLNYAATQQDMSDFFAHSGSVLEAILITDRTTGNSRGFGFVTMESESDALNAIHELNGKELLGRPVKIKLTFDREERPSYKGRSHPGDGARYRSGHQRRGGGGHRGGSGYRARHRRGSGGGYRGEGR